MAIRLTDQVKKLLQKKYKRKQGTRVGAPKDIMKKLSQFAMNKKFQLNLPKGKKARKKMLGFK